MQGDLAPARALTEEPTGKYLKARVGMAALFVALNDKERALSALEKGCNERSAGIVYVKVDEHFAPLRDEPRFKKILARMHLS